MYAIKTYTASIKLCHVILILHIYYIHGKANLYLMEDISINTKNFATASFFNHILKILDII
jgi:hypothetical protein